MQGATVKRQRCGFHATALNRQALARGDAEVLGYDQCLSIAQRGVAFQQAGANAGIVGETQSALDPVERGACGEAAAALQGATVKRQRCSTDAAAIDLQDRVIANAQGVGNLQRHARVQRGGVGQQARANGCIAGKAQDALDPIEHTTVGHSATGQLQRSAVQLDHAACAYAQ